LLKKKIQTYQNFVYPKKHVKNAHLHRNQQVLCNFHPMEYKKMSSPFLNHDILMDETIKKERELTMSITQKQLFGWKEIEELGDLERLNLVLKVIPDEEIIQRLERERSHGRDDYPVHAVWNSILAGIVYQHPSIESLRRELMRNETLLALCGFDVLKGIHAVPTAAAYSRFLKRLIQHKALVRDIFTKLVHTVAQEVPDFGSTLAIDGKKLDSFGNPVRDSKKHNGDKRRDTDADWGVKTYAGINEQGKPWEKVVSWFGYKLHLLVDADYELPVDFRVTQASKAEQPVAREILDALPDRFPDIVERAQYLCGDRGYDDQKILHTAIELGMSPIIDIRNLWKDGEKMKMIDGAKNVAYDYRGNVTCFCPVTLKEHRMCYGGYEQKRQSHKYLCPARAKGIACAGQQQCTVGRQIRIPLTQDRRIFTPTARSSYKWERIYDKRTAIERVNSRIDNVFMFEQHYIRGIKKMETRITLAFIVMLSMALGRVRQNRAELMRSLVRSTA